MSGPFSSLRWQFSSLRTGMRHKFIGQEGLRMAQLDKWSTVCKLVLLAVCTLIAAFVLVNSYRMVASANQDVERWLTPFVIAVVLFAAGSAFILPSGHLLPHIRRIEISAIFAGSVFTALTALFLYHEYDERKQAGINRSWQLLYQVEDRAEQAVCEALAVGHSESGPVESRVDCTRPPTIPQFKGKLALVCHALREFDRPEVTNCHRDIIARLGDDVGMETICHAFREAGLLDDESDCVNPVAEMVHPGAWEQNFKIAVEMRSDVFGQLNAVQSLFDYGLSTQNVDLRWFNLERVVAKRGQDLRRANLSGTNLRYAKMDGVILGDTIRESNGVSTESLDMGSNLSGADLSGARFVDAELSGADLSDVYADRPVFARARLRWATLHYAIFINADLSGADLSHADLFGATLRSADLSGATLQLADLTGAHLSQVDGLTQDELDKACASSGNKPTIVDSNDANTMTPLEWGGGECP